MDGLFDEILSNLNVATDKAKKQIDQLLSEVNNESDHLSLNKLNEKFNRMERALKSKDIDELQNILKDAD